VNSCRQHISIRRWTREFVMASWIPF